MLSLVWSSAFDFDMSIIEEGIKRLLRSYVQGEKKVGPRASLRWLTGDHIKCLMGKEVSNSMRALLGCMPFRLLDGYSHLLTLGGSH